MDNRRIRSTAIAVDCSSLYEIARRGDLVAYTKELESILRRIQPKELEEK